MNDYTIYYKTEFSPDTDFNEIGEWDYFFSAFTQEDRTQEIFPEVKAAEKIWIIQPEFNIPKNDYPTNGHIFSPPTLTESEFILSLFQQYPVDYQNHSICFDITGLMRPQLMFLLRFLFLKGIQKFDILYTEPLRYEKDEDTPFSTGKFDEVRQVEGFEGQHMPTIGQSDDLLIIGTGYDHELIAKVAESKNNARKLKMFGFPSLRPHMYQENVQNVSHVSESLGANSEDLVEVFIPANDPFITAQVLQDTIRRDKELHKHSNLYLCPLGTKVQALGFALFYIGECLDTPTSILYPFRSSYSSGTGKGIARIWKYTIETTN